VNASADAWECFGSDDEGRPTYLDTDEKLVFYCAERALQECDSA
jgi:hypothetical protein